LEVHLSVLRRRNQPQSVLLPEQKKPSHTKRKLAYGVLILLDSNTSSIHKSEQHNDTAVAKEKQATTEKKQAL